MKSDNISYRYNEEKMAFVLEKEGFNNPRRALDFLLDKYWWENKMGFINAKFETIKPLQTGKLEKDIITQLLKPTIVRNPEQWLELKRSCESMQEWQEVKKDLVAATNLSDKQKQIIINTP